MKKTSLSCIIASILVFSAASQSIHFVVATSISMGLNIESLDVTTATGDIVQQASLSRPLVLSTTIKSTYGEELAYIAIFDIRDENSISVNILTHDGAINANDGMNNQVTWTPDKEGTFSIRVFFISDRNPPIILSSIMSKSLIVTKFDEIISQGTIPNEAEDEANQNGNATNPIHDTLDEHTSNTDNGPAPFTIMIYMVASDLESQEYAASADIKEMMDAEIDPRVNVLVQTGGSANSTIDDQRFIDFTKVQRHEITGDEIKTVAEVGERNMGDSMTLANFVRWAVSDYPAEKYAIIVWDHGNGIRGFGYDDIYGDVLTLREIDEALDKVTPKFEIIGFDSCLMATFEVALYLTQHASYMVASEELEPQWGWDYKAILSSLNSTQPDISFDGLNLGKTIADSYVEHSKYKANLEDYESDRGITLSVIDLSKIKTLSAEIETLGDHLKQYMTNLDEAQNMARVVQHTERYGIDYGGSSGYADLFEIAGNAGEMFPGIKIVSDSVRSKVDDAVVYNVHGEAKPDAHGLSIFLQLDRYETGQEYLYYLVPEWLQLIESSLDRLDSDDKSPEGSLDYTSGNLEGYVKDDDLSYGIISIYEDIEESSKYQLISYYKLDSSNFFDEVDRSIAYELDEIISLCNESDCAPVFVLFEDFGNSQFAYFPIRLESGEGAYNENVTLIYELRQDSFIFHGAWGGFEAETAQKGFRPLNLGDKIFTHTYEYDLADEDYFAEVEKDQIEVTETFGPKYAAYAKPYTFIMQLCDFSDNCVISEEYELEV